jgi:hypothetical protein
MESKAAWCDITPARLDAEDRRVLPPARSAAIWNPHLSGAFTQHPIAGAGIVIGPEHHFLGVTRGMLLMSVVYEPEKLL